MLYYTNIFHNAEEFRTLFGDAGYRIHKTLLAVIKSPLWREQMPECRTKWDGARIFSEALLALCVKSDKERINLGGVELRSDNFKIDEHNGLCLDEDYKAIRYYKEVTDNQGVVRRKTYKMRAAKLFRKIVEENGLVNYFTEPVLNWLCEEFQARWEAFALPRITDALFSLHVSEENDEEAFDRIYSTKYHYAAIHSCMNDQDQYQYYVDAVKAKAAWLEDRDGKIVARCVIFTEVEDCKSGEVLRLAERQYALDDGYPVDDEMTLKGDRLREILVERLIRAGEIDGYKRVGASYDEQRAFVSNDKQSWSDRRFVISAEIEPDDTVISYQDSFVWYDYNEGRAYNFEINNSFRLNVCDRYLEDSREYDDYHCYYCNSTVVAICNGHEVSVDSENLDEFVWSDRNECYIHKAEAVKIDGCWHLASDDDVCCCPECGYYFLIGEGYYSELTDEYYDCPSCMDAAEERYKQDNWYYSELLDECFEYEADLEEAELEYKKRNWYHSPYDGEYYETRSDSDDNTILGDWVDFLHENLQNLNNE